MSQRSLADEEIWISATITATGASISAVYFHHLSVTFSYFYHLFSSFSHFMEFSLLLFSSLRSDQFQQQGGVLGFTLMPASLANALHACNTQMPPNHRRVTNKGNATISFIKIEALHQT